MSVQEVINSELIRIHELISQEGMWNGEEITKMLEPLYLALLELSKRTTIEQKV